jgi:hypothetical protein
MRGELKRTFGSDFHDYQWLSYPTNNFGLATMYVLRSRRDKPQDANQWCAAFTCIGVDEKHIPSDPYQRLTLDGFADVGSGGPVELSENDQKQLASGVFLPAIQRILGISGDLARDTNVQATLSMGSVNKRVLKRQRILDYIQGLDAGSEVRKASEDRRLAIVVADLVIDRLQVTISLREGSDLSAKLDTLANRLFGRQNDLQFRMRKTANNSYRITVSQPVIVARLTVKQISGQRGLDGEQESRVPTEASDWAGWGSVTAPVGSHPQ